MRSVLICSALALAACASEGSKTGNAYSDIAAEIAQFEGWTLASGKQAGHFGFAGTVAFVAGSEPDTGLVVGCSDGKNFTLYFDPQARTNVGYDTGTLIVQVDKLPSERFAEVKLGQGLQGLTERTAERSWRTMSQAKSSIRIEQFGRSVEYAPDSEKVLDIILDRCSGTQS